MVGDVGTILATTDGGAHWKAQNSGSQGFSTTDILESVAFTDATHGWVVGMNGTILRTTDGGAHWNYQVSGISDNLISVAFADARSIGTSSEP